MYIFVKSKVITNNFKIINYPPPNLGIINIEGVTRRRRMVTCPPFLGPKFALGSHPDTDATR